MAEKRRRSKKLSAHDISLSEDETNEEKSEVELSQTGKKQKKAKKRKSILSTDSGLESHKNDSVAMSPSADPYDFSLLEDEKNEETIDTELSQTSKKKKSAKKRKSHLSTDSGLESTSPKSHKNDIVGKSSSTGLHDKQQIEHVESRLHADGNIYAEDLEDDEVELFLCQIPAQLDVQKLQGKEIAGDLENVEAKRDSSEVKHLRKKLAIQLNRYSDIEIGQDLSILCESRSGGDIHAVNKTLVGSLMVTESIDKLSAVLPTVSPKEKKQLPSGLRQRHFPFGSDSSHIKRKDKKKKKSRKSKSSTEIE